MGAEGPGGIGRSPVCPCCGGRGFEDSFEALGHRFEACRGCGYQRMADPPSPEERDGFYKESRRHGEEAWAEHGKNLERFAAILRSFEEWIPPGRFLDLGCSLGTSLVAARDRGWDPVGVELSGPVAAFGRKEWGLEILETPLPECGFETSSFDGVLVHHTLEHLGDPLGILREIARVLRPGGILYLAVPNHASLKAWILGPWFGYGVTVEHLHHFSPSSLRSLVRRAGFHVLRVLTRSYREDPRMVLDLCGRLGWEDRLAKWCGFPPGEFDQEAYVRFITDRPLPRFLCTRAWPARLAGWLGLGEDLHLLARLVPRSSGGGERWKGHPASSTGSLPEDPPAKDHGMERREGPHVLR